MRKEYIDYERNLPINISLVKIRNYPISWQDSLRIFFVLEGEIKIDIGHESFGLKLAEIEIVNAGEIYSVSSEKDNLVMVLDIRPDFFSKYVDGVEKLYYYTNSLEGVNQWDKKYRELRKYLARLYYEFISREEGYDKRIEEELLKMMYHLLNNFHYLFYEEESLREDEVQFQRFNRIINYLRENYREKISLSEIAEREYLTSQYLSYKIKDTFGQSFNDFLNIIRVEESRKLLLDTDRSISDLALSTGFSHSRYYNKHFKKLYGMTPLEYRELHKKTREEIEREREIYELDLSMGLEYLTEYLMDYGAYKKHREILKRTIDLEGDLVGRRAELKSIIVSDVFLVLDQEYSSDFRDLKEDLGLEYIVLEEGHLREIFSRSGSSVDYNRLSKSISAYRKLGYNFLFSVESEEFKEVLEGELARLDLGEILGNYAYISRAKTRTWPKLKRDSLDINREIIDLSVFQAKNLYPEFRDQALEEGPMFFGGRGLFSWTGLKKPSYYGLMLINLMSRDLIYLEEGLVVSKSSEGFQILIYDSLGEIRRGKKVSLNIAGLRKDYILRRYGLNRQEGSSYDKWLELGRPNILSIREDREFKELVKPSLEYKVLGRTSIYNIIEELEEDEYIVYDFRKKNS